MAYDIQLRAPAATAAPAETADDELQAGWGERIVTVIATSVAVLIVASIAVLMGMA